MIMRKFFTAHRGWIEPGMTGFLLTSFVLIIPQLAQPVL